MKRERFEELMVKVTDDTATPPEREELMAWIADKDELQRELEAHVVLRAVTDGWVQRLELDVLQDQQQRSIWSRLENALGLLLVFVGLFTVTGWALVELFSDPEVPLVIKLGTGALSAGFLLLLWAVARRRLGQGRKDRYADVIR